MSVKESENTQVLLARIMALESENMELKSKLDRVESNGGNFCSFLRYGRKDSWCHLLGWWNMMILIFFIIFGARSLTRVILAFGEHNHESGNWLQK